MPGAFLAYNKLLSPKPFRRFALQTRPSRMRTAQNLLISMTATQLNLLISMTASQLNEREVTVKPVGQPVRLLLTPHHIHPLTATLSSSLLAPVLHPLLSPSPPPPSPPPSSTLFSTAVTGVAAADKIEDVAMENSTAAVQGGSLAPQASSADAPAGALIGRLS